MRPGLLCPGSANCVLDVLGRRDRFNEAGAVMPRKLVPPGGVTGQVLRLQ